MAGNVELVLQTLSEPDFVLLRIKGEKLAIKGYSKTSISKKSCVVVFRENDEGFVITAFLTSQPSRILKKGQVIWKK